MSLRTSLLDKCRPISEFRLTPFDQRGAFRPVGGSLRRLAVRGAAVTVSAQGLALAVQLVATVVLARLLTPADFGIVAMVTTFSLLLVNFGLNGFTEAIIQQKEINHFTASNLFWINVGLGILLTVAFAATGSLLAWLYHNPLVAHVTIGVSLTIFFTCTGVLHLALLKRAMRFTATSANDIFARGVSVAIAIMLALGGWGYWALVAGVVAGPLSATIGAWWLCRWVPGLPKRAAGTGATLRFALNVYGRFGVRYCSQNMDKLLVGWRFNAASLGFYKKAYDLFALSQGQLTAPLHNVALATLSRLSHDRVQFKRYLVKALSIIAFVGMGLGADLTLTGRDVIRFVLGPKWGPAGAVFTLFGPGIGIMLLYSCCGWIHLSIGKPGRWLRWSLVEFVVTVFLFVLALPWGPAGVAAAWSVSFWILAIPAFWYAGKPIGLGFAPIVAAVWRYVAAAVSAGVTCAIILRVFHVPSQAGGGGEALARITTTSLLFVVLYLTAVILFYGGLEPLSSATRLLREVIPSEWIPEWFYSYPVGSLLGRFKDMLLVQRKGKATKGELTRLG